MTKTEEQSRINYCIKIRQEELQKIISNQKKTAVFRKDATGLNSNIKENQISG